MYYENRVIDVVNDYRNSFESIYKEYKESCNKNDFSLSQWRENKQKVEKLLLNEISSVKSKELRDKILKLIYNPEIKKEMAGAYDFARFCYLIDGIKDEKYTRKVAMYNKNFCLSIMIAIAIEYNRILYYMDVKGKEDLNSVEYNEATKKIADLWSEMYHNRLSTIICEEYEAVIRDVETNV